MRQSERANRSKTKLLANLSHELRTPLNAMIGFTEMVRLGYKRTVSDDSKESLDLVLRSAKHLDRLVATLLDMSRIELDPAALEIAEADANAALGDALAIVRDATDRKELVVACDLPNEPLVGQFDRMRFVQVAVNLLSRNDDGAVRRSEHRHCAARWDGSGSFHLARNCARPWRRPRRREPRARRIARLRTFWPRSVHGRGAAPTRSWLGKRAALNSLS